MIMQSHDTMKCGVEVKWVHNIVRQMVNLLNRLDQMIGPQNKYPCIRQHICSKKKNIEQCEIIECVENFYFLVFCFWYFLNAFCMSFVNLFYTHDGISPTAPPLYDKNHINHFWNAQIEIDVSQMKKIKDKTRKKKK